jgi:hypothetical protein
MLALYKQIADDSIRALAVESVGTIALLDLQYAKQTMLLLVSVRANDRCRMTVITVIILTQTPCTVTGLASRRERARSHCSCSCNV